MNDVRTCISEYLDEVQKVSSKYIKQVNERVPNLPLRIAEAMTMLQSQSVVRRYEEIAKQLEQHDLSPVLYDIIVERLGMEYARIRELITKIAIVLQYMCPDQVNADQILKDIHGLNVLMKDLMVDHTMMEYFQRIQAIHVHHTQLEQMEPFTPRSFDCALP